MPLISPSSYKTPRFSWNNSHWQTIVPSYLHKAKVPDNYVRDEYHTPDNDILLLDWARVNSKKLLILSHGLCGHSRRHYILSLVNAFNAAGWDCLAWNFRGTGGSPGITGRYTTQNSTEELHWITQYALSVGHYDKVAYTGYSMGGNLSALYLCREQSHEVPQICGGIFFCATTDLMTSNLTFHSFMGRRYTHHFLKDLFVTLHEKADKLPAGVDVSNLDKIKTFEDFDDRFTSKFLGMKDHVEYYQTASACHYFDNLKVPVLLVAPKNDPFLAGDCYPVEQAKRNPMLYLEMPEGGGHCGFPTPRGQVWWPAQRALEFLEGTCLKGMKESDR